MNKTATKTATAQMIRCRADELAIQNGCYFDPAAAERVRQFIARFLRYRTKDGIKPIELSPWQAEVTDALFGWRRKDGKRRFREAYISMGKKGGKTFWAAILLLVMLTVEIGPGQECYSFATEREQASMTYREAAKIARASPALKKLLQPMRTTKTITFETTGSFFRSMSAEADSADGINAAFVYYDEIHRAHSRELYDTLKYSGTAIEARGGEPPLFISTTTAGHDRESICYEVYNYAKRVRTGEIADDAFYTYIAEADAGDDWTDEKTWHKANPSLGTPIMPLADFRRDFAEARNNPAAENRFRRLRLNQWTEQATRWIPLELWDRNGGTIDPAALAGRECWGAMDLSSTQDTTAVVLIFRNERGGYDIIPHVFVPHDTMAERGRRNGVNYSAWANAGQLLTTPGVAINPAAVRDTIIELSKLYQIREIAYDPWNATIMVQELEAAGITCLPVRQGFSLSAPAKELYRLLLGSAINHGDHPVLRWQAGNVEARTDKHENLALEKPGGASSKLKIDAIVATVMAIDRAMRTPADQPDDSGLMIAFA